MRFRLKSIEVEAIEMTAAVEISVGHGTPKTCQVGDFLVRNPDGSMRLVGHEAFFAAYEPCDPSAIPAEAKPKRRHRRRINGLGPLARVVLQDEDQKTGEMRVAD